MSDDKQIEIKTIDDFLRWLDSGRQLAIETLSAAGIREEQALKFAERAFAGSTISSSEQSPVYVNLEIEAAFNMLRLVERIAVRVTGKENVPLFSLVLDGVLLNDFRQEIYRARWRRMDQSAEQSRRSKKRRTPTAALADELRRSHDWANMLPRHVGAREIIGEVHVTFQSDGSFLVRDTKTGKSTSVKQDSIRSAINKNRT